MPSYNRLGYLGIMTGYVCSAKCRHCMYCSTPSIEKEFIGEDASARVSEALARAGVDSVHIGGGEPFLHFDSLRTLLTALKRCHISVDYIETNASWCVDEERVMARLDALRGLGARCVMASVDPFHIEFVPLARPLMLVRCLRAAGMDYFIWQEKFLRRLLPLDHSRTYTREELKTVLGEHYAEDAAREYGLGINGRALVLAHSLYPLKPADKLLSPSPCRLLDGLHCHVDLYENIVPGRCPGIAIGLNDFLEGNVPVEKYPVAARLLSGGIKALYAYARDEGFEPSASGYITACELCYFMRSYLRLHRPSRDIEPSCFYSAMEAEYLKDRHSNA